MSFFLLTQQGARHQDLLNREAVRAKVIQNHIELRLDSPPVMNESLFIRPDAELKSRCMAYPEEASFRFTLLNN